jgi:two-component system alkaline phosphatase synthesis response regulator PhoP
MAKILLIEDEESLNHIVTMNLEMEGHEVEACFDGEKAMDFASSLEKFDLVILDVMLPKVSGWEICETFKKSSDTPILFVSARGTSSDKVKGLKLGADDYLAKPFDLEELLLRVQILTQRSGHVKSNSTITIGDFEVNLNTFEVLKNEDYVITLSKREIEILKLFNNKKGEVVSRDNILDDVWGKDQFPTTRTIDNYILHFRKIFEQDPKEPKHFLSIRGVGYKFVN